MTFPLVDCQGLAGGYTLGAVSTGRFELVHRVSLKGGFGDKVVDQNRHLLGHDWLQDDGGSATEWTPGRTAFLCGTPPCSGFSQLSIRSERGPNAPINSCMWELIDYAGRCVGTDDGNGPEIVSFESVQAAYTKGRSLMRDLRERLESRTGQRYDLHHVLMSGGSVGSAQYRHRYYVVFARVPFGVEPPQRENLPDQRVVTYYDAIADLQGLELQWEAQPRRYAATSEYARRLADKSGIVTQHVAAAGKIGDAVRDACEAGWPYDKYLSEAFDLLNVHPKDFNKSRRTDGVRRGDSSYKGLNWPIRVNPGRSGRVQTGGCARELAHWTEPRLLTIRELSRMMGYPDTWTWPESVSQAGPLIGKCAPVQSCRWISSAVADALDGHPGTIGERLDDGEYYYNSTRLYREWLAEQS